MPGRFSFARLRQSLTASGTRPGRGALARVASRLFPDSLVNRYPGDPEATGREQGVAARSGRRSGEGGAGEVRLRARVPGSLQDAFTSTPDPRFFFADPQLRSVLEQIALAVTQRRGTVIVAGESGSGKTTLLRYLSVHWGHAVRFLAPALQLRSAADVLGVVMRALGQANVAADRAHKTALAQRLLAETAQHDRRPLALLVDDAHEMSVGALDQLAQLLAARGPDGQPALQVVLAARELSARQRAAGLRVGAETRLHSFPLDQVPAYVQHRLAVGGHSPSQVFSDEALVLMGIVSGGRPRAINQLAERALRESVYGGRDSVSADGIALAAVACGYGRILQH